MKKILLSCFAILFLKCIYGQDIENFDTKYREEVITKSDFVFEGAIVKASTYRRNDVCIVSYIVRVNKVLRGNLKPGTVEIVNYAEICPKERVIVNLKQYSLDTVGFFFCNVENELAYDKKYNIDNVDNTIVLSPYQKDRTKDLDWIYGSIEHEKYYKGLNKRFETKNDVYKYLKLFPNINVPFFIDDGQPLLEHKEIYYSKGFKDSLKNKIPDKKKITHLKSATTLNETVIPRIDAISTDDGLDFITGRGQIITIIGEGFGNTRGTGFLSFTNADDGGTGGFLIDDKDVYDYQVNSDKSEYWTDQMIKFRLPTYIYKNNQGKTKPVNIGSGPVRVTMDGGFVTSEPFYLSINSSIMGAHYTTGEKTIIYLENGSLSFRLNNGFTDQQRVLIQRAMDEWSCRLNVNIIIDQNSPYSIGLVTNQPFAMQTGPIYDIPDATGANEILLKGSNISINNDPKWDYALPDNTIAYGNTDFYHAILHELGHALLLGHIIDWDENPTPALRMNYGHTLMYYLGPIAPVGGLLGAFRTDLRTSLNDENNANYIVQKSVDKGHFSRATSPINCPGAPNPPSNATATVDGSGQVIVSWTSNATNVDHFAIERSVNNKTDYIQYQNVNKNTFSFTDGNVGPHTYYYRITAVGTSNPSSYCYSNPVTVTGSNGNCPCHGLKAINVTQTSMTIIVNNSNGILFQGPNADWHGNASSYNFNNLTPNSLYQVWAGYFCTYTWPKNMWNSGDWMWDDNCYLNVTTTPLNITENQNISPLGGAFSHLAFNSITLTDGFTYEPKNNTASYSAEIATGQQSWKTGCQGFKSTKINNDEEFDSINNKITSPSEKDKLEKQKATFSKVEIYPNPTNGNFTVRIPDLELLRSIEIIDNVNRTILKSGKITDNEYEIDISSFSSGVYMVHLEYNDYSIVKKIVKL